MSGVYPYFKPCYKHEELVEHFLLTPADLQLVLTCRGDANRCGMALLLKALRDRPSGRTIYRSSLEGAANVQAARYQRKG